LKRRSDGGEVISRDRSIDKEKEITKESLGLLKWKYVNATEKKKKVEKKRDDQTIENEKEKSRNEKEGKRRENKADFGC
jgi:hypothetical protein